MPEKDKTNVTAGVKISKLHWLFSFLAGMFLFNAIPHFINGISGNAFPTPFADPPGKGLSSPELNVAWAILNIGVGYLLARSSVLKNKTTTNIVLFLIGAIAISLMLSIAFTAKAAL